MPVAAILVASIRLHFVDVLLHLRYRGPNTLPCDASLRKGEEMGWFQHGSTMIAFAPPGVQLCAGLRQGDVIRMGQPLLIAAGQRVSEIAVITGTTHGIGRVTSRELARAGRTVVMLCRDVHGRPDGT